MDRIFLRPQFSLQLRGQRRMRFSIEARADYSALFLLKGHAHVRINETESGLKSGDALLVEPYQTAAASGNNVEYIALTLSPAHLLDCAARTGLVSAQSQVTFRVHAIEEDDKLARLAGDIAEELSHSEAGQEEVISALLEQVTIHLLRRYANVKRSDELELSRVGLVDRRIRRAVELMHAHLDQDLPLEELASAAHLSPFHFARLFKKLTGASPHAYLANLRATRAQALLAQSDLSVTEVAARVGYSSPSHFTKAFRQATGLTPRAFRAAVVRG